jgi:hypothetical protein
MKDLKLWEITTDEKSEPTVHSVKSVNQTKTEEQLEEMMVRYPELLFDDLKLIGRQTETAGGPLDLLGVDADGRLVVFELKKGILTREAVSQIIDYTSYLSELEPEDISKHISERSGNFGIKKIDDFLSWYQEEFSKNLSTHLKPRMVLVGLGADDRTRRMVSFLADSDIDVSLITFYGFEKDGKTFLAKQIEVEAKEPTVGATKKDNLAKLQQKAVSLKVGDFYFKMASFFREQLSAYEWPNPGGYAYAFSEITDTGSESYRVYVSLYIYDYHPGKVEVRIHPRAIEAALDGFGSFKKTLADQIKIRADGGAEIWIKSLHKWENLLQYFKELCPAIKVGWQSKREQRVTEEHLAAEKESSKDEIAES